MQRYFLSKEHFVSDYVKIDGEEANHISRVMRMKSGGKVICCDHEGACFVCEIQDVTPDLVEAKVIDEVTNDPELPIDVTIAHGLPKGDKLDWVIQKGTELGAYSFIPFQAERSIVKWEPKKAEKKRQRWTKIAKEASEQSHRRRIPSVKSLHSLKELIDCFHQFTSIVLAYEEDARNEEKSRFFQTLSRMNPTDSLLIVIGPEGGFSKKEVNRMKDEGAVSCALGPRILRSETAPLYGLAAISYHFELLG